MRCHYHVYAVVSCNKWFTSCGTSGENYFVDAPCISFKFVLVFYSPKSEPVSLSWKVVSFSKALLIGKKSSGNLDPGTSKVAVKTHQEN